jgi:hypothetical protein
MTTDPVPRPDGAPPARTTPAPIETPDPLATSAESCRWVCIEPSICPLADVALFEQDSGSFSTAKLAPMTYFKNCSSAFLWGFSVVWLFMLLVMTYVVHRDGPPNNHTPILTWSAVGFFWLGGIALAFFSASKPCFELRVESQKRVSATWRYPLRVVRRSFIKSQLCPAQVVESRDSEGDPYYIARVMTSDGTALDIQEGHRRSNCENACSQFNDLLFREHIGA